MMNNVINEARDLFDKFAKSPSAISLISMQDSTLLTLGDDLKKLLEVEFSNDEVAHLFCRRLEKLIDNISNDMKFQCDVWKYVHEYLPYVLHGSDVKSDTRKWERFLAAMQLEGKLERRESQYVMAITQRKDFSELLRMHQTIINDYLTKCIAFHSKVQIENLIDNIDDLLYCTYKHKQVLLTRGKRAQLEKKLKSIEISFDCAEIFELDSNPDTSRYKKFDHNTNSNMTSFLPTERRTYTYGFINTFDITRLRIHQCTVILGNQQCGKTTLVRWLTRIYAESVLNRNERNLFRIPILIRIKEFADCLRQYPNLTLIDYISQHLSFLQKYHNDDIGNVLKKFIDQGFTLILLDGLDEIRLFDERCKIVNLIKNFIDDYIHTEDFFSPFDDPLFDSETLSKYYRDYYKEVVNSSKGSIHNQIIITSRFVGYDLCSLSSPHIEHFSLVAMKKWNVVLKFASQWVKQVEQNIRTILIDEGIQLGEIREEILMNRLDDIMNLLYISDQGLMNPYVVTLFCKHIFTLSNRCSPQSPIEIYGYAVNEVLRAWTRLEPILSKEIIFECLSDLAVNIYIQSSTYFIDEFDMKQICYLAIKRFVQSNNRQILQESMNKILSLFNSNLTLINEQGLEVYSFVHASFHRYFIIQALLRESSSIENIIIRFFKFVNQPSFYQSLLLAIGWISSKWSLDKYNEFCQRLISHDKDYALPLGSLLLFDALQYIHNLPSKDIIFCAFNHLLDHPSKLILQKYLRPSQLPSELIQEWMQLNLTNEKRLVHFCRCLLHQEYIYFQPREDNSLKDVSVDVFQQLWLLRHTSLRSEIVIDHTLNKIMKLHKRHDLFFEEEIDSYLLSKGLSLPKVHPLILSIILALRDEFNFLCPDIQLSSNTKHCQSSRIERLMTSFVDVEHEFPSMQRLSQKYETILQNCSPNDTSFDIIRTFLVFICLSGVSEPSIYAKFSEYKALPLVLVKFKQIFVYLTQNHLANFISEMESIFNEFFDHSVTAHYSDEEIIRFLFACVHPWKQLEICCLRDFKDFSIIKTSHTNHNFEIQFEYRHYILSQEEPHDHPNDMMKRIEYTLFDLLVFIPKSLQLLFYYLVISPLDTNDSLSSVVFIFECLIFLDNIAYSSIDKTRLFLLLYPLCRTNELKTFISILYWNTSSTNSKRRRQNKDFQETEHHTTCDQFPMDMSQNRQLFIDVERKRIQIEVKSNNTEKDLLLLGSCLCLARLIQAHYRSSNDQSLKDVAAADNEDIYYAIENMNNPIYQLIVLDMILRLKRPLIFSSEQISRLNRKIITLLNQSLINLPLLFSTYLFVRNYQRLQLFPSFLQSLIKIIGEKFLEPSINRKAQESAYIALRMLNDDNLSDVLSIYERQTNNLSNILQFNSTTFFDYFSKQSSFDSSNLALLSSMYLIELSQDIQILDMYTKRKIPPQQELDQLWKDPSKYKQIMTIEVAQWITDYLKLLKTDLIDEIIERVLCCYAIDQTVDEIISQWFEYQSNEQLKFFAYYAALFCAEDRSIEILKKMFKNKDYLPLNPIIKTRLELKPITPSLLSFVIIPIIQNISVETSACIYSKEILDKLFQMERERISSKNANRSFLSTVRRCSPDLQKYLIEHIQRCKEQEEYLVEMIRWMVLQAGDDDTTDYLQIEAYNCLMILVHDQQIPLVQRIIVNCINTVLTNYKIRSAHVFLQTDLKIQLESLLREINNGNENDLLAPCLLTYGNCLLKFSSLRMDCTISIDTENILEQICHLSTSDVLSIRAYLCLLFSKIGNKPIECTLEWVNQYFGLSVERRLNALLQLTLYRFSTWNFSFEGEIKNSLKTDASTFVNRILEDAYNELCNKEDQNRFLESLPAYVRISQEFFDVLDKTSIDRNVFRSAIYQASKKFGMTEYLHSYLDFGELTDEFVDALVCVEEKHPSHLHSLRTFFPKIKTISGRDVIEALYRHFQAKFRSKSTFSIRILELIVYLAQKGFISSIELHHQVSIATNHELYEYDKTVFVHENDPFFYLMTTRKFVGDKDTDEEERFLTIKNIEERFKENIQRTDQNSSLIFDH